MGFGIIGWSMSHNMRARLVNNALKLLSGRKSQKGTLV